MPNFVTIGSGVSEFRYSPILPFSIGIAGRPYNSVSTTVLHCDSTSTEVLLQRKPILRTLDNVPDSVVFRVFGRGQIADI